MRAKRLSKNQKKQQQLQTSEQHRPDPAVACFALDLRSETIAVAVGGYVRINKVRYKSRRKLYSQQQVRWLKHNCWHCRGSSAADQIVQHHTAPVRAVSFHESSAFLTAGDDKLLKVYNTKTWEQTQSVYVTCLCCILVSAPLHGTFGFLQCCRLPFCMTCRQSAKKITAAIFSQDGNFVVFADKYGDVATAKLQSNKTKETECAAAPLLGHLCSIITSLAFSPNGSQLVSTDQDCKVRVSTMPTDFHKVQNSTHWGYTACCA